MTTLKKVNESKAVVILLFATIFLLLLYCNFLTPLSGDDYVYMFNFKDESRIESFADIFPSLYVHRFTMNGRVLPHFFAQLFLLIPLPIFKVLNAGVFTYFIFIIYHFARRFSSDGSMPQNALAVCVIFGSVWVLSPGFNTLYLWLAGACNYLWTIAIFSAWLYIMAKDFMEDLRSTPPREILFALLSLVVGNYSENSSVAAVFMALLFIILSKYYLKRPLKRWHITSLCAMLVGFLLLALAPAELTRKIAVTYFSVYVSNFVELILAYLKFWPLVIFYVFSYWYSHKTKQPKRTRILSLVLIGGSLASHFVLIFALYIEQRSTYIAFFLLLLACALFFFQLFSSKLCSLYCALSAILLSFTMYWGVAGIQDMQLVHYKAGYNDEYIRAELAAGRTKIGVPYIVGETEYSCFSTPFPRADANFYANISMAKYYGADTIHGYWFYEVDPSAR